MDNVPFFIAFSGRSGSHLLASLINSTGAVCPVAEHLGFGKDIHNDSSLISVFEKIGQHDREKRWGTKVDARELSFVERYLHLKNTPINDVPWIWLRRRNKLDQALSHLNAVQSGFHHYYSDDPNFETNKKIIENLNTNYPMELINSTVMLYMLVDNEWQIFFSDNRIEPLILFYEDFIQPDTWDNVVAKVLNYLNVPIDTPLNVSTTHVRRSSGKTTTTHKSFYDQPLFYKKLSARYGFERIKKAGIL